MQQRIILIIPMPTNVMSYISLFPSAVHMLSPDGNVCISLCGGQGGTPADTPVRAWSDSWQVVAMAAESEFVLRQIWPFSVEDYPAYNSTGYR